MDTNRDLPISRTLKVLLALALVALAAACGDSSQAERFAGAVEAMTKQSTMVFEGTVIELGKSSVAVIDGSQQTVLVRVIDVVHGPAHLDAFVGQPITLLAKGLDGLEVDSTLAFFATGWVLGESLALKEEGRLTGYDPERLRSLVEAAVALAALEPIARRVAEAEVVFAGTVLEIRDLEGDANRAKYLSAHRSLARLAVVEPTVVLKAEAEPGTLEVVFPASIDVAWHDVPKPTLGREAVWILKMDPELKRYVVRQPHDLLPMSRFDQVQAIAKRSGSR